MQEDSLAFNVDTLKDTRNKKVKFAKVLTHIAELERQAALLVRCKLLEQRSDGNAVRLLVGSNTLIIDQDWMSQQDNQVQNQS